MHTKLIQTRKSRTQWITSALAVFIPLYLILFMQHGVTQAQEEGPTATSTETPTYYETHTDTPTLVDTQTDTPAYLDTETETLTDLFTPIVLPTDTETGTPTETDTPTETITPTAIEGYIPAHITSQIILRYKSGSLAASNPQREDQMQRLAGTAGVALEFRRVMSGGALIFHFPGQHSSDEIQAIVDKLNNLPEVEYAEPDWIMYPTRERAETLPVLESRPLFFIPSDPLYTSQWHYFETWGVNTEAAWDITTGSASVTVAVIDTGITNHAEFSGRTVEGYDFVTEPLMGNDGDGRDGDPSDPGDWITSAESASGFFAGCRVGNSSWHGTHTAGTIGASGNNGQGVAGINWNSKIQPVRVLGKCGGYYSDVIDGMRWAAGLPVTGAPANPTPAKVLSISLGGSGACSTDMQTAINEINAAGAVVVVSAGNSNANAANYNPAGCNGVITVAATNRSGNKAYYSNYGTTVEISAPGGETSVSANGVLSTLNTGTQGPVADTYAYYQGTSMSAPHVSGVVSLLFSADPTLTPAEVLAILQSTAKAFPAGGSCTTANCGSGIVDAGAALSALGPEPTPSETATGTQPTPTEIATPTLSATYTPSRTRTITPTSTETRTPTVTPTRTQTPTPTATPTRTPTDDLRPMAIIVLNTNDSGPGSLRQAVADIAPGGSITFDPSLAGQTITLASTIYLKRSMTIDGSGLGSPVEISGNNTVRIFQVDPGGFQAAFIGFVVKDGYIGANGPGGGIVAGSGTVLTLQGMVFRGNSAYQGGAVYLSSEVVAVIQDCEFTLNTAPTGAAGAGAIFVGINGSLTLSNSTFTDNSGPVGGAIWIAGGSNHIIEDNNFTGNSAQFGGAMYITHITSLTLSIRRNTFSENTATSSSGGAIYVAPGSGTYDYFIGMENNTFYANQAMDRGGAIFTGGKIALRNNTFSSNRADGAGEDRGESLYFDAGTTSVLYNNIIANAEAGTECSSNGTIYNSGGNNLVEDGSPACMPSQTGDPMLDPLADNGGPTFSMMPQDGSPAIDAGDDVNCPFTDQRGFARPVGAHCDLGAVESGSGMTIPTRTHTPSPSLSVTFTPTNTPSPSDTFTATPTGSPSRTNTPPTYSLTPTPSVTETPSPTNTRTRTNTRTPTRTRTETNTPSITDTPTITATPTETPTGTLPTSTETLTPSITFTPSNTFTRSLTRTPVTPTLTPTRTPLTPTRTSTNTPTITRTRTATPTPTITDTPSITQTPSVTNTGTLPTYPPPGGPTVTGSLTPTHTPTGTLTPSSTASATDTPTPTSTATPYLGTVVVTVLDTNGNPEVGINIQAYDGDSFAGYGGKTDSNGQVVLTLPAGSYRFRTAKNGTAFWSGPSNHCTVPGCTTASITTTLPVIVTVLDSGGTPVAGVYAVAFDGSVNTGYSGLTNAAGQASLTLPQGSYRFRVYTNNQTFWSYPSNHCTVPGCTAASVTVDIPVVITVLDTNGNPEVGINIQAYDGSTFAGYGGKTNAQGQVSLTLPAGSYRFRTAKNGTTFWSGPANHCAVPGCTAASITTTVPVIVTVLDGAGTPIAGVYAVAFNGDVNTGYAGITNASGQASLTLPQGSYRFRVYRNNKFYWSGPANHCSVPGCTTASVTVDSPVVVTVLDTNGDPQVGINVQAYDGSTFAGYAAVTNAQGQASLTLPAGSYRFRTAKNGTSFWSGPANHCTVPGCTTASITTTLPVIVTVLDGMSRPRADQYVRAMDGDTDTGIVAKTNAQGQASLTLPLGSYRFRAYIDNRFYYSGTSNHCTVPGCTSAGIATETIHFSVMVFNPSGPEAGQLVEVFTEFLSETVQPVDIQGLSGGVADITMGQNHVCALTFQGGVKCWGSNYGGELGDGTYIQRFIPVDVVGLTSGVVDIEAGETHTCAVLGTGGVKCWGANYYGSLGDGTDAESNTPVDVVGLGGGITQVALGWAHTCALSSAGTVQCWGNNSHGELGDGTNQNSFLPVNVVGIPGGATEISAGGYHTCALVGGGTKCWGYNFQGELGNGNNQDSNVPVNVVGMGTGVLSISAGYFHNCAIMASGVKCWGYNNSGQLGNGTQINSQVPVDVYGLESGVVAVSAGVFNTCAIMDGGAAKCWGINMDREIVDGPNPAEPFPVDMVRLNGNATQMEANDGTICALADGGVKCWGWNGSFKLGSGPSHLILTGVTNSEGEVFFELMPGTYYFHILRDDRDYHMGAVTPGCIGIVFYIR